MISKANIYNESTNCHIYLIFRPNWLSEEMTRLKWTLIQQQKMLTNVILTY